MEVQDKQEENNKLNVTKLRCFTASRWQAGHAIRDTLLKALTDEQIEKLKQACEQHTIAHRTGDITIDTCFDADRMDLPRVGITPLPDKMATKKGAQLVGIPDYADFYAKFKKGEV